jgi:hypothetical protein
MLTIAALFLGLATAPQACPGSFPVTARAMGPLPLGESVAALKAGYKTTAIPFADERYTGVIHTVAICGDTEIDAITQGKHSAVDKLRTASPIFLTAKGAHVGMTVAELRQLYPNGKLNIFIGEGAEANFDTGMGIVFDLDGAMVPHGCYDNDGVDCSGTLESFTSIDLYIRAR